LVAAEATEETQKLLAFLTIESSADRDGSTFFVKCFGMA
jgi:hypothetical protein